MANQIYNAEPFERIHTYLQYFFNCCYSETYENKKIRPKSDFFVLLKRNLFGFRFIFEK